MEGSHVVRARAPRTPVRAPRSSRAQEDVAGFLEDAAHHRGRADEVAFPETEGEWAWLLTQARPVLAVGAQSSLTRGGTPDGGLVASTRGMRGLLEVTRERVRAQPGLTLQELLAELAPRGLAYPPAPTWHGATLGGVVSTNAAGAATFKHGTTRRWVRGLTVVLAGGDVLEIERGQHRAGPDGFELVRADGVRVRVPPLRHRLPDVPKRSAGYHAEPGLDLVDLFVGSEGTLGVVTEVVLDVVPRTWDTLALLAFFDDPARGLATVGALRDAARLTWASRDPLGVDVAAIEHVDARGLRLLAESGALARIPVPVPATARLALLVLAEMPLGTPAADQIADVGDPDADSAVVRLLRLLRDGGASLENMAVALPSDARTLADLVAFREAVPLAVNELLGRRQRDIDAAIHKVGGDVIVPFERLGELLATWESLTAAAGLDALQWGHVSDGNIHPNVLPRSAAEVAAGEDVLLALGRAVIRMGGCPMAEHGVGRSPLKQQLLRELVGEDGLAGMKAVKASLDPLGLLAPGVLWPR